jgi:hypothetical protein
MKFFICDLNIIWFLYLVSWLLYLYIPVLLIQLEYIHHAYKKDVDKQVNDKSRPE